MQTDSVASPRTHRWLMVIALLLVVTTGCAGEKVLTIRDHTGRGFVPDLVEYDLPRGRLPAMSLVRTVGEAETPLALQVMTKPDGTRALCFVADVLPGQTSKYLVRPTAPSAPVPTGLAVVDVKGGVEFANALLTVRLPEVCDRTFDRPVPADKLPAPILAFRSGKSAWMGGGKLVANLSAKRLRITLVAKGPVYAEMTYRIEWSGGGWYEARIRVIDRVPLVKIREEFDLGRLDGSPAWELDLAKGWSPDRAETAMTNGNGGVDHGRIIPLDKLMKKGDKLRTMQYMVCDNAWGPISHLGLFVKKEKVAALADAKKNETPERSAAWTYAAVIPLHKGDWRRATALEIHSAKPGDTRVRFPLGVRHPSWKKEVTSAASPFSTQEHDLSLPLAYGRRVWGLGLARPALDSGFGAKGEAYLLRQFYGIIGLNAYKDFILDWPDGEVAYPRVYVKADEVEAFRKAFAASPVPDYMKKNATGRSYILSGSDEVAAKQLIAVKTKLNGYCKFLFQTPTPSHHGLSQWYKTAAATEDILAWPGLDEASRTELRTKVALLCHAYEHPDMGSYANGHHHGNPNMGTARLTPASTFLALVPDHPLFPMWRKHMGAYALYKASTQIAPGGAYFEYGAAYHLHGGNRLNNALLALDAIDAPEADALHAYYAQDWDYFLNLLTPYDSRWKSRIVPGMANSPPGNVGAFSDAAAAMEYRYPKLSAKLHWAWLTNGAGNRDINIAAYPAGLPITKPELTSRHFPGFGVIFRAHQGPKETYMALRSGFLWSHWYTDPGHFILSSRGATLVPSQPYQYHTSPNIEYDMYNTVRFGHPENKRPHGWPDGSVLDTDLGGQVEYAWSSTGFPDWFITPGASPEWVQKSDAPVPNAGPRQLAKNAKQTPGAFTWDRQVLFLKGKTPDSPNYFVFRDTMPGDGKLTSYLYLNLLGRKKDVTVTDGLLHLDSEWDVDLDVNFLAPKSIKPEFFEENHLFAFHGTNLSRRNRTADYTISPNWVGKKGKPVADAKQLRQGKKIFEQHVITRLPAAPGEGYLWVVYPRKANEAPAKISRLADGVLRIVHPEGTDYAFLSTQPLRFEGEGIVFEGNAGAVRVGPKDAALILNGGKGRVGYKGYIVSGEAPFAQTVPVSKLEATEVAVASTGATMPIPEQAADRKELAPGLSKVMQDGGVRYRIDSRNAANWASDDGVRVQASRAFIEHNAVAKSIRFVVPDMQYACLSVGNVGVRGCGPFDITLTPDGITGKTDGELRTIITTFPENLLRPEFRLDGVRYLAGWADDHSIYKGTKTPQFSLAFAVTEGAHKVTVSEWTYPPLPEAAPRSKVTF